MANMYLTSTARFKPFSYQEMLVPIAAYKESFDKLETEYGNLDILGKAIKSKLNPGNTEDQKLLATYDEYEKELNTAFDNFYSSNHLSKSKKDLTRLKARFSELSEPITEAYTRRTKMADFIEQQRLIHPELLIENTSDSTSAYMYGKSPAPTVVNLEDVETSSKNIATGLSKQFIKQIELQSVEGYVGRYLMNGMVKGIDNTKVSEFINNYLNSEQNIKSAEGKALLDMFKKIRAANNYDNLSDDGKTRLDASIINGFVQGAAADMNVNYNPDNYWQTENIKLSMELAREKLKLAKDKANKNSGTTGDYDVRTNTYAYVGENNDVAAINKFMSTKFKTPIEFEGTKISDPIQAYNIIHKHDARINELESKLSENGVKIVTTPSTDAYGNTVNRTFVQVNGVYNEEYNKYLDELNQLEDFSIDLKRKLKDYSIDEEDVARFREYLGSNKTGQISLEEIEALNSKLETDLTAGAFDQKVATIFSHTNSKDGLADAVNSISSNLAQSLEKGNTPLIYTNNNKVAKKKELKKLLDKYGKIDVNKIDKIELDFYSAKTGRVRLVTSDGKVFYVDSSYLGDQASMFITNPSTGLMSEYEKQNNNNTITAGTKADILNNYLTNAAQSIQSKFTRNRDQSLSATISNKDLNKLLEAYLDNIEE